METYIDLEKDEELQKLDILSRTASDDKVYAQLDVLESKFKAVNKGYSKATQLFRTKQFTSGAEYIVLLYKNMQLLNERSFELLQDLLDMDDDRKIPEDIYRRLGRLLNDTHAFC